MIHRAVILWRDADRFARLQAAGASVLVLLVFGVFAYGAATREPPPPARALAASAPDTDADRAAERETDDGSSAGRESSSSGDPATTPSSGGGASAPASDPRRDAARQSEPAKRRRKPGRRPAPVTAATGDDPLVIGVVHRSAGAAAAVGAALGLTETPGDAARQARVVADWINANGGAGGRPVELRIAAFDPTISPSFSSAFAAACEAVAGGGKRAAAVVGALDDAAGQAGCLAPKGIPLVGFGPAPGDATLFGSPLFAPGGVAIDRLVTVQMRALAADGFLDSRSRVGIVRLGGELFDRVANGTLRPALERAGAKVAGEEVLPGVHTAADAASLLLRADAAAARLRVAGADRVVLLDAGVLAAPFMRAAERQSFRPRYALSSSMAPASLPGRVPAAQLAGAAGVGVAPLLDVAADSEPAVNAARERCEQIYRAADVPLGPRTVAGHYAAIGLCDALLTVRAAVAREPNAAVDEMPRLLEGSGAVSGLALATRLAAGRRDGASEWRRVRFDGGCGCVRYQGPGEALP